ncbi:annexin A5a isoform X3 [Cebidichthys violaceus]|uniref:annexin A5a isoform X3 n=1 Tax=Cebidichthys violaceus TaxID=271503 RepID=UPI0035CC664E
MLVYHLKDGAGTEDDVLIEILASRTGEQIKDIIKVYKKEFNGKLEKDVCDDTSGHYRRLLVILLQGSREVGVDEDKIEKDAKDLYAAGEGKFGTDEEKFITILGNRSAEHLRKVFEAYKKLSGSEIEDSIEGETTGNLENLLLAVVKCARSVPQFFAEGLYRSMRHAGTDDDTLMRIMVSRSEVDMLDIRACFKKTYGASLYDTTQFPPDALNSSLPPHALKQQLGELYGGHDRRLPEGVTLPLWRERLMWLYVLSGLEDESSSSRSGLPDRVASFQVYNLPSSIETMNLASVTYMCDGKHDERTKLHICIKYAKRNMLDQNIAVECS